MKRGCGYGYFSIRWHAIFGYSYVHELIRQGHNVTIATRQTTKDNFGDFVQRIQIERIDAAQIAETFKGKRYDVVYDKLAYCSNDVKYVMDVIDCDYVEGKTGGKVIISSEGENAPYNGEPEYSINTDKVKSMGFQFSDLRDWIYDLVDYYIELLS